MIISNKNGVEWLPQCFASLHGQTAFDKLEIILVDNCSTDGSAALARRELAVFPQATVIENTVDVGYTGGNNIGANAAKGEWLFILNNDTRLEPDCIERMLHALKAANAQAACAAVAEMGSMKIVPAAPLGFDIFGRPSWAENDHTRPSYTEPWHPCFMIGGCGFIVRSDVWEKIGGFDVKHYLMADDDDISWKIWLAGYTGIYVTDSILHHRNRIEDGSWEIKGFGRYLVNRNSLLVIAKNAQHVLLLCGLLQILMLMAEAFLFLLVSRSWKFVWHSYFKAIIDAFKMWRHVLTMRQFNRQIRRRSDWFMIRNFLRFRLNRWDMVEKFFLKGKRPLVKIA